MKTRLPWLLLIVSVAFNIFAAAGYMQAREQARRDLEMSKSFRGRADLLARKLDLTEAQHQQYEKLLEQMEHLRTDRAPQRDAFWQELVKEKPDQKLLENYLVGPEAQKQRLDRLQLMRKMVDLMTPQQRDKLVQLLKKPDAPAK